MNQRRLVSTIASVATGHLAKFPPSKAILHQGKQPVFQPEVWALLQPSPPSALSAFAHRIGLGAVLGSTELIQQACTHPSFLPLHEVHSEEPTKLSSNAQLAVVGNSLMGLFATEHIQTTFPYLPTRVLKAAVTAYVGPLTCASVAQEMGATPLLRWHRTPRTSTRPALLHTDALASIPRALTALVCQHRSLPSARQFVQSYFLSRRVDLRGMLKFRDPKAALLEMVEKFGRERPKSRLLKETGRYTNSPVFVVGIYSGQDLLGEGFGSSLKMAEFRAAEDALLRVYLTQRPPDQAQVPSSTFGTDDEYTPPELVSSEVMYMSSGRQISSNSQ